MSDVTTTTFISAQVPAELYESVKQIADRGDRSVSAEVRRALKAHVEKTEREPEEAPAA